MTGTDDPRWLGAWWIGWWVGAFGLFAVAVPILAFAKKLPESEEHRKKDVHQAHVASVKKLDKIAAKHKRSIAEAVSPVDGHTKVLTSGMRGLVRSIGVSDLYIFMCCYGSQTLPFLLR